MPKCRPLQLNITCGCPICPYHGTALNLRIVMSWLVKTACYMDHKFHWNSMIRWSNNFGRSNVIEIILNFLKWKSDWSRWTDRSHQIRRRRFKDEFAFKSRWNGRRWTARGRYLEHGGRGQLHPRLDRNEQQGRWQPLQQNAHRFQHSG